MDDLEREIERIDRGGDAWREADEVVPVHVQRPLTAFVSVRVPVGQWRQVRQRASELGVDPNTLVQEWIAEKLHAVPTA